MKKRKYLGLALALGIGAASLGLNSASANIYAGSILGDDITVTTTYDVEANGSVGHAFGIYTNTNNASTLTKVGDRLKITTSGGAADGIRTTYGNGNASNNPQSSGIIRIGDDLEVTTNGRSSDAFNINGSAAVYVGKNATLITTYDGALGAYEGAHGLRLNHNGSITVEEGLDITTYGEASYGIYGAKTSDSFTPSASSHMSFDIANNSTIETHGKSSSAAQMEANYSTLEAGDNATWTTHGESGHAIYAGGTGSSVALGKNAVLTTEGDRAHGILIGYMNTSAKTKPTGQEATVSLGEGARISTSGDASHGAYMYGTDGLISLGANTTIETTGDGSHGLYGHGDSSYGTNGKIEVGDGLDLTTSGTASHGAYTDWASSSIEFKGGATINIDGTNSYALYANVGRITSKLDASGNVITDQDGGNFQIVGDMKTDADGNIELYMGTGSVFIGSADQGAGHIYLHMQDGSTWYVTKDKDALVCLDSGAKMYVGHPINWQGITRAPYTPSTITNKDVMTANGGTIHFQTDIVNQQADYLILEKGIQGSGGFISVTNQGSAATVGNEIVPLMDDQVPQATPVQFALTNVVELGGYNYVLDQRDDGSGGVEWYLKAIKANTPDPDKPVITNPADAGVNIFSGAYLLNYAEMNTLLQRMGDLRQGESKGNIWARTYGGKFDSNGSSFLRGFDMNYWGLQVGADKKFSRKDQKGDWYVGGMFGYSKGNLDYGYGSGSIDSKSIGAYGTYIAKNGFYSDLVLKYNWMKNDFKVLDSAGNRVTGKDINTDGLTASLEIGRRYHFNQKSEVKEGWYVEPQAQLSMGHNSGGSFRASNGLKVDVDSYNSLLGRIGLNIGKEIKSGKNPVNAYAKVSYVHEFDGDVNYYLNSSKEDASFGDSWWVYGVGITAQINKKHNLYLDIERASGGKFTQSWAINGGYRFSW